MMVLKDCTARVVSATYGKLLMCFPIIAEGHFSYSVLKIVGMIHIIPEIILTFGWGVVFQNFIHKD